jgi:signal peptidase II
MQSLSRAIAVALTLCGCVGCDQASKAAARTFLRPSEMHAFLADLLRLQRVENPGSFLSLGAGLPQAARFWLFTAAVGLLLIGLVGAALYAKRLDTPRAVALALIAGGGCSNFIDRLLNDGRVTDFLNIGVGFVRTGIFNLADMLILGGALLLVFAPGFSAAAKPDARGARPR